jgi:ubiquinone/menaquinone biosynthesis C-methylase UbiE
MDEIGVKEGMTVADVGIGDGYFTFHLAERVGNDGKVFSCDIDNRALQVIRDKCAKKGIQNISVILGKEDDPLIP